MLMGANVFIPLAKGLLDLAQMQQAVTFKEHLSTEC